jgi:hypothetical protein
MKNQIQKWVILFGAVILASVILAGCQKLTHGGKQYPNSPPSIFWADVPIVHQYTRNPSIHYYSTDRDGLVLDYQYCVLLGNAVDSVYGGPAQVAANVPDTTHWTIVHTDSTTVSLYASPDTSVFVDQYVFIKAMDDDSMFSPVIYMNLARKNHPPTCYLVMPSGPQFCLPDTTPTWKGIKIVWIGKDSIDIPGIQPDFDWNIRRYGPFTNQPSLDDTLGPYHPLLEINENGDTLNWIRAKGFTYKNLTTGWYIVYAQNRDDAFTVSIPARALLEVYEPRWIHHDDAKPILFVDHSTYYASHGFPSAGDLVIGYRDSVNQFYDMLVQSAGYDQGSYDWYDARLSTQWPPKSVLANYKLVIVINMDRIDPLSPEQDSVYCEYLNVGGKLWVLGRRTFVERRNNAGGRVEFGPSGTYRLPYNYLDLSAIYADMAAPPHPAAEFIGASSLMPELPDLQVDTLRVSYTSVDTLNFHYHFAQALRCVDFVERIGNSDVLYNFNSIYPDTSRFNGFPVAMRYNAGSFKTAYFTFPLYFIQTDQAEAVTQRMLEWFFSNQ